MGVVAFDDRCAVAAVHCVEMEMVMVMLFSNDSIAQVFCFPQAALYVGEQQAAHERGMSVHSAGRRHQYSEWSAICSGDAGGSEDEQSSGGGVPADRRGGRALSAGEEGE